MSLLSTFITLFVVASSVIADTTAFKPPINNTLEPGVATECKTCPYSLCTNKAFYNYETEVSLICWTKGTPIGGDKTWLKTSDGCFVTQYDLADYNGTYENDLSFCGKDSEDENITYDTNTVKYDTECNICPDNADCETVSYLRPKTDITTTCWTDQSEQVVDDIIWLKTTENCYVAEIGLNEKVDKTTLDYCGVIGFIQLNYTGDYAKAAKADLAHRLAATMKSRTPSNEVVEREQEAAPLPSLEEENHLRKRYLVNFTVGEDYAVCHTCLNTTCETAKRYPFDKEVILQCYEDLIGYPSINLTAADTSLWFKTTDFCWVRAQDFWQDVGDQYRFPACSLFEDADWIPPVLDDDE